MKAHRYPEACAAFEQSQRLDPQLGTLFNLANCEVEIDKLASAWKIYRELAKSDPNRDRKALSSELAAKLEPRLPRFVVVVPAMPAQLAVAIDAWPIARRRSASLGQVDVQDGVVCQESIGLMRRAGSRSWAVRPAASRRSTGVFPLAGRTGANSGRTFDRVARSKGLAIEKKYLADLALVSRRDSRTPVRGWRRRQDIYPCPNRTPREHGLARRWRALEGFLDEPRVGGG